MKKKSIIILSIIIPIIILLFIFVPYIKKGMQINKYQDQLTQLKQEWDMCEIVQKTNHEEAEKIRVELSKLLGLTTEQEQPQRTGTEAPELSGYIIE